MGDALVEGKDGVIGKSKRRGMEDRRREGAEVSTEMKSVDKQKSWRKRGCGEVREKRKTERGKGIWEIQCGQRASVDKRVRAARSLDMALDAVPPVKTHIYLSNFYQLNGYSPESPIGAT